jgi:hypothetical protein
MDEVFAYCSLPHEHQNPNAGIVWDEEKVYATLQLKLFQGREYVVRIRLYFSQGSGETAVMLW